MTVERTEMPRVTRHERFESQRRVESPRRPEPLRQPEPPQRGEESCRREYREGFNDGVRWATRNPDCGCGPESWGSWGDDCNDSWYRRVRPGLGEYPSLGVPGLGIDLERLVKLLIERAERPPEERPDLGLLIDLFA